MIFHNRYLSITDIKEMGQYTFDNLKGFEGFSGKVQPGDFVIAGRNFGSGSSRQQAVDCFISLGVSGIIAESFGSIYERNAINAGFPIITCASPGELDLQNGDIIKVTLRSGELINLRNGNKTSADPFSDVQIEIYQKGNLLG
jgi:3-isopropylmalate/(R)-2-methylmalate dehydratase large subunit